MLTMVSSSFLDFASKNWILSFSTCISGSVL